MRAVGASRHGVVQIQHNILAGKAIDVFNNGHHRRDFTYIDDVVEGVLRTANRVPEPNSLERRPPRHTGSTTSTLCVSAGAERSRSHACLVAETRLLTGEVAQTVKARRFHTSGWPIAYSPASR